MRNRLPVLRERRRYMAFEIEAEGEISSKKLMGEIHSSGSPSSAILVPAKTA